MNVNSLISQFARYIRRINDFDVSQMCGLAEGTNAHTLKTTTAIYYGIYNQFNLTKAATDNIAMTACAEQPISSFCYYLVSLNSAGTVTVTKGTNNTYALPTTPAGNCAIGAFKVTTDASHTFTSGTTDLSATGVTTAFYDIDCGIALSLINQAQARLERGVTVVRDGRQRTVADWNYMLVRTTATIAQGDTTVTLPFPKYKDFVDGSLTITDATAGVTYPLYKEDVMPLGVTDVQNRPCRIARLPEIESTFTTDGEPAMDFTIWPESDNTYTIDVTAYQYSPDLDGVIYSTNWLTENAPDVLLFGALVESIAYFPSPDQRAGEWKERWNNAVFDLMAAQNKEKYSGAPLFTKYPNPLNNNVKASGMSSSFAGISSYGYINTD